MEKFIKSVQNSGQRHFQIRDSRLDRLIDTDGNLNIEKDWQEESPSSSRYISNRTHYGYERFELLSDWWQVNYDLLQAPSAREQEIRYYRYYHPYIVNGEYRGGSYSVNDENQLDLDYIIECAPNPLNQFPEMDYEGVEDGQYTSRSKEAFFEVTGYTSNLRPWMQCLDLTTAQWETPAEEVSDYEDMIESNKIYLINNRYYVKTRLDFSQWSLNFNDEQIYIRVQRDYPEIYYYYKLSDIVLNCLEFSVNRLYNQGDKVYTWQDSEPIRTYYQWSQQRNAYFKTLKSILPNNAFLTAIKVEEVPNTNVGLYIYTEKQSYFYYKWYPLDNEYRLVHDLQEIAQLEANVNISEVYSKPLLQGDTYYKIKKQIKKYWIAQKVIEPGAFSQYDIQGNLNWLPTYNSDVDLNNVILYRVISGQIVNADNGLPLQELVNTEKMTKSPYYQISGTEIDTAFYQNYEYIVKPKTYYEWNELENYYQLIEDENYILEVSSQAEKVDELPEEKIENVDIVYLDRVTSLFTLYYIFGEENDNFETGIYAQLNWSPNLTPIEQQNGFYPIGCRNIKELSRFYIPKSLEDDLSLKRNKNDNIFDTAIYINTEEESNKLLTKEEVEELLNNKLGVPDEGEEPKTGSPLGDINELQAIVKKYTDYIELERKNNSLDYNSFVTGLNGYFNNLFINNKEVATQNWVNNQIENIESAIDTSVTNLSERIPQCKGIFSSLQQAEHLLTVSNYSIINFDYIFIIEMESENNPSIERYVYYEGNWSLQTTTNNPEYDGLKTFFTEQQWNNLNTLIDLTYINTTIDNLDNRINGLQNYIIDLEEENSILKNRIRDIESQLIVMFDIAENNQF